ncbi:hypothetical protein NDU88_003623 [Pleurodeles waltl]|uniref:Uncharacterized protein n=1 Tax=Pleurodeles waltl TaxID=8319 RepID=A0AAV7W2X8_PLEWA|nr:hypothetical protein NDU88_003623 [Pleurodeles waltl]
MRPIAAPPSCTPTPPAASFAQRQRIAIGSSGVSVPRGSSLKEKRKGDIYYIEKYRTFSGPTGVGPGDQLWLLGPGAPPAPARGVPHLVSEGRTLLQVAIFREGGAAILVDPGGRRGAREEYVGAGGMGALAVRLLGNRCELVVTRGNGSGC